MAKSWFQREFSRVPNALWEGKASGNALVVSVNYLTALRRLAADDFIGGDSHSGG